MLRMSPAHTCGKILMALYQSYEDHLHVLAVFAGTPAVFRLESAGIQ